MKKTIGKMNLKEKKVFALLFFIISLTFYCETTNAQISLEYTFNESVTWFGNAYIDQNLYPSNSYYSANIVNNSYVVKIYNADYSINSNTTYNFTPPTNYKVSTVYLSRNIFNTDDNYEFLVTYERTDNTYDNTRQKIILYNQNGSTIKDFGFAFSTFAYPSLNIANNKFRLLVYKYYYDGTNTSAKTEVYLVPGTPPSNVANIKSNTYQQPYPNPSNSLITLPYQLNQGETSLMKIYNTNGKLIETKQIDFTFDKILLNISNYSQGIYIYEVNGLINKFIVN